MKRSVLTVPLAVLATAAAADEVVFESGEHGEFTRLVARLPSSETQWSLTGGGERYRIKVEGDDVTFQTDAVFNRIGKDRVANIVSDPTTGELELQLACRCRITTAPFKQRYVIFDIFDAEPEESAARLVDPNFALNLSDRQHNGSFRFALSQPYTPLTLGPRPKPETVTEEVAQLPILPPARPRVTPPPQALIEEALAIGGYVERQAIVGAISGELYEQIGRAATQNLLEPDFQDLAFGPRTSSANEQNLNDVSAKFQHEILNISTYNAVDEAGLLVAQALSGNASSGRCYSSETLDISSWSDGDPFEVQLAKLRKTLAGEKGPNDPEVLEELAQLYIHFTFGLEAIHTLEQLPRDADTAVIKAMAALVEGGKLGANHPFVGAGHCESETAFWAALSGEVLFGSTAVDAALNTMNGLPRHLREHLGPRLSRNLLAMGQDEAAALVLNAIERTTEMPSPQFEMAQAALEAHNGDTEAAAKAYEKLANDNTAVAPLAMVDLIDAHVAGDLSVSDDNIALVGALAVEHKSGQFGPELRRAHVLARVQNGEFATAFALLAEVADRDGAASAMNLRNRVASTLADTAGSYDFVEHLTREQLTDPGQVSAEVAINLANRAFELGFLNEAKQLLQTTDALAFPQERRVLKAQIALAENLPRRAEAELLGMTGPEVDTLRATARSMAGDHVAAAEILAELGESDQAMSEAWLGSDWQALSASEEAVYRDAATLLSTEEVAPAASEVEPLTPGVLSRNRALLEESERAREVVNELLKHHQISGPSS